MYTSVILSGKENYELMGSDRIQTELAHTCSLSFINSIFFTELLNC